MERETVNKVNTYLHHIRRREEEYVELLYALISPAVRHIALKYLHNAADADDLVQDFWADIYVVADKFVFSFNGYAYLLKVAANKAKNRVVQLGRHTARAEYVDYADIRAPGDCAEDVAVKIDVGRALDTLDETERIIIQATYFEQKTVRQIAAELNTSKTRVGNLKQRAMEKLKKYFSENSGQNDN